MSAEWKATDIIIRTSDAWVEVSVDGESVYAGHKLTPRSLEEILLQIDPMFNVRLEYDVAPDASQEPY